ncbi:MAG: Gfo/Idh/MocA family oxidoreductase [Victivallaceae bacterium]|nr:Gfo/Idh/MocA family oxidoreductase [Victivallaceae bacterium]
MLEVGIIGYGDRISRMACRMKKFHIPFRIKAVGDPRADELRKSNDPDLKFANFYNTADEMLEKEKLDGVMIGTRCSLHAELACKAAGKNIPLFIEKPVAISFEQLDRLAEAFSAVTAVVVSFPLRVSPLMTLVKEIIDSGRIGKVWQIAAFNDVVYGNVYFGLWYRDYEETGGLFLQKATHDLDYVNFLAGGNPEIISAMSGRRFYGGDKPFDLKCVECDEFEKCSESPFYQFQTRKASSSLREDRHLDKWQCVFSKGLKNEDIGQCLIEYDNGVQASYTQNFFVHNQAGRRGARIYGTKGTVEFDWIKNYINVFSHASPSVDRIELACAEEHFGGDLELCYDFLAAMRDGKPSRCTMKAGIVSALLCLCARESAAARKFIKIKLPAYCL